MTASLINSKGKDEEVLFYICVHPISLINSIVNFSLDLQRTSYSAKISNLENLMNAKVRLRRTLALTVFLIIIIHYAMFDTRNSLTQT